MKAACGLRGCPHSRAGEGAIRESLRDVFTVTPAREPRPLPGLRIARLRSDGLQPGVGGRMNPFLFKAHPLLYATISLLIGAGSPGLPEMAGVLGIYLAINLPLAMLLAYRVRRLAHIRLRLRAAYPLALPATVLYTPIALTLLDDVVRRAFHLEDRFLLLFALVVATALLAALFGVALHDRNGEPLGSEGGLMLALTMLLACVPYGLVLLALDRLFNIFPVT